MTATNYTSFPNTDAPVDALVWMSTNLPFMIPMILFLIFITFTMGNFMYKERRNGKGNFIESCAFGSTITMGGAIVLNLIPGLFNPGVLGISFSLMAVFVLWYLIIGGEE
jgi:ABC-type multidrug transport system permease subunit